MQNTKSQSPYLIFILPILLATLSLGCNLTSRFAEDSAVIVATPTRTPLPTFTPTPEGQGFVEVATIPPQAADIAPTPTPVERVEEPHSEMTDDDSVTEQPAESTATATLVVQSTPTPAPPTDTPTPSAPVVSVKQDMNVRGGPGTNYPVIGSASSGDISMVTGRNQDSSWVQVEYPSDDGKGWVYTKLVEVNGDLSTLQVAQASMAPLPPPTAVPEPKQEEPPPPPAVKYQFTPGAWHASENAAIVHFKGRIQDEGGNLVNGYSILLDNWSWRVQSHPTGASQWYPEKGPGEWDVVMPELHTAQGWWWISVVRYKCGDFFAGFDSQCLEFDRLSEEVKIEVRSPHESIINADWICHWDCNKGIYSSSFLKGKGYVGP